MSFPILGAILYVFLGNKSTGKELKKKLEKSHDKLSLKEYIEENNLIDELKKENLRLGQSVQRINETTGFPLLKNDTTKYYPFGEDMFAEMCEDLKKAERYIFIEYFIIQRGVFWDTLTEILTDRAAAGVDVRVMYDDVGSIATYSVADIIASLKSDYGSSLEQCRQRSLADINNGIFNRLFDCGLRAIAPLL